MKTISAFTFVHNAIESGYPIVEAIRAVQPYVNEVVVVDMESTDGTRSVLRQLNVRILDGQWGTNSGTMLDVAYKEHEKCRGDLILHFEADEVYDKKLLNIMDHLIFKENVPDIAVHRIQLEQNFQRCKWYPEPVHRLFPRLSNTRKKGHTSTRHEQAVNLGIDCGLLWDISNCFRDNWLRRIEKMAEYRNEAPNYLMVPIHCALEVRPGKKETEYRLNDNHWTWNHTPFDIPYILRPLVGMTKYEPRLNGKGMIR